MRIHSKLLLNTIAIITCLCCLGGTGLFFIYQISQVSINIIKNEVEPIVDIHKLQQEITHFWHLLNTHYLTQETEKRTIDEASLNNMLSNIEKSINNLEKKHNNPPIIAAHEYDHERDFANFKTSWQFFLKQAQKHLRQHSNNTNIETIQLLWKENIYNDYIELNRNLTRLLLGYQEHILQIDQQVQLIYLISIFTLFFMTVLIAMSAVYISNHFSRKVVNSLLKVNERLKEMAQGKLPETPIIHLEPDEISEIIQSVQQLKIGIQSSIEQAYAIAAGDYGREVNLLSEEDQLGLALQQMTFTLRNVAEQANAIAIGDYTRTVKIRSERDELGQTLNRMRQALIMATEKNQRQDWLKSGQNQLATRMRGVQEPQVLATQVIQFLAQYTYTPIGAIYLLHQEQKDTLYLTSTYAYKALDSAGIASQQIKIGEGLIGQVALECKSILYENLPLESNNWRIDAGLVSYPPSQIYALPLIIEQNLVGVVVLGNHRPFTVADRELFELVANDIAISILTAQSRLQLQTLLEESQNQQKILAEQQQALKIANDSMLAQQEELRAQNEQLHYQQEILQMQQDTLTKTNQELEQQRQELHEKTKIVEAKNIQLEEMNKYKSEFLANMSHELRTPLNSMLILSQLLADNRTENLTSKQVEYAQTIYQSGTELLNVINDVLDLSKVAAGKLEVIHEDAPIIFLIQNMQNKFTPVAERKGLYFNVKVESSIPDYITSDPHRIKQILNNLISNGLKFCEKGGVTLKIECLALTDIKVPVFMQYPQVIAFHVIDTGIGIPLDKHQVIFETFRQADGTTSRRFGGTGLGLSISLQIARMLGGDISVQSEENKGSIFTLYLPNNYVPITTSQNSDMSAPVTNSSNLLDSMPMSASPTVASTSASISEINSEINNNVPLDKELFVDTRKKKLLIIEDDPHFVSLLAEVAYNKGFECIFAKEGKTGLEFAKSLNPEAIILDIGLPELDGFSVMTALKEDIATRHIPVHFISALDQAVTARRLGAIGYLRKPANLQSLADSFRRINQFVNKISKNVLILVNPDYQAQITYLLSANDVNLSVVHTCQAAIDSLQAFVFDVIILDIEADVQNFLQLLPMLVEKQKSSFETPIIIYVSRDLTAGEMAQIVEYQKKLILKLANSPARLLEETALFLHQVSVCLTPENLARFADGQVEAGLANKQVLIIDDDIRDTFTLTVLLEERQMKVFVTTTAEETIDLLNIEPAIALILINIKVKTLESVAIIQQIRAEARFQNIVIIALTTQSLRREERVQIGVNDYFLKPIDTDKLLSLIRVWLHEWRGENQD